MSADRSKRPQRSRRAGIAQRQSIAIAPITEGDLPQVIDLLRAVGRELDNDEMAGIDAAKAAKFVRATRAGLALLLGARAQGRLVGYARLDRRVPRQVPIGILSLHVLAPYRGQGLGERLLRGVLAAAPRGRPVEELLLAVGPHGVVELCPWPSFAGIEQVWLWVDPDNTPALRLYQKLGFTRAAPPIAWPAPASFVAMVRATAS